jgi:gliding motility-associated-like protein
VTLVKETGPNIDSVTFRNPSSCINNDGYIRFHGIPPGDTIIVTYTYNGVPIGPITRYVDADSNILFSNLFSGVYDLFYFKHDSCLLGPFGPYTLVAPPIHISNETITHPDLCGRCNGSISLYGLLPALPVSVTYSKDGVVQPPYTGTVGLDSVVHLDGLCAGSYTGIVATIGSCSADGPDAVIVNPPAVPATFTYATRLHCTGDEVVVTNTSTPPGYSAYWDFGDGTPVDSSGANPLSHIYNDAATFIGNYTVKLVYSTYHTCFDSTTQDVPFDHNMLDSFAFAWPAVCLRTEDNFLNYSRSMNSLTYLWDFGDGFSDTAMSPSHTYGELGGIFPVTLTITDTIGCKKTTTQNLEVISVDVHTAVHDTSLCLRDSMWLQSTIRVLPDTVNFISVWTPNVSIGEDSATNNTGHSTKFFGIGTFNYTVTAVTYPPLLANPAGCNGSDTERIVSYPPVTITNLTPSPTVIAYGSPVQLNASGAVYYTWKPDDGTLSNNNINNPVATPLDSTTIYTVYGMNLYGCLDSGQIIISVDYNMSEGIPTGFTPNGDGLNDVFRLTKLKYQKLVEFSVFNRWGQQVFKTTNPEKGWDGTYNGAPQDIGVYNYLIIVARPDGTNKTYSGNVTLIR